MVACFSKWSFSTNNERCSLSDLLQAITGREGVALLPFEVRSFAEEIMEGANWTDVSLAMRLETAAFVENHIVKALASLRSKLGMFSAADRRDKDLGREAIMELDDGELGPGRAGQQAA